jgi:uncharacterized protein YndB with AHSA1/START domain
MAAQRLLLASLLFLSTPATAHAAVRRSAADGFTIEHKLPASVPAADLFRAIGQVDKWWSSTHSWSGSAANLSLKLEAGGCFCERWAEGSAEHGRVVQVQRDRLVRLNATLGPLLEMAVSGALTFQLSPAASGSGTDLIVTYRISGDSTHGLRALAGPVDKVIGEAAARLVRFAGTGKPE